MKIYIIIFIIIYCSVIVSCNYNLQPELEFQTVYITNKRTYELENISQLPPPPPHATTSIKRSISK